MGSGVVDRPAVGRLGRGVDGGASLGEDDEVPSGREGIKAGKQSLCVRYGPGSSVTRVHRHAAEGGTLVPGFGEVV